MKDLKKYCKSWIDQNMCDGYDRSEAHDVYLRISSPDLYEIVDDMLDSYIEAVNLKSFIEVARESRKTK